MVVHMISFVTIAGKLWPAILFFFVPLWFAGSGEPPQRVISLAPSLTEMVFAVGAGEKLVGVTEHCRFPAEAAAIPRVGGYQTPNFEAILSLQPDIVLTLEEHFPARAFLNALGVPYEAFDHRSLEGVLDSLTKLGRIFGNSQYTKKLRNELDSAFRPPEDFDPKHAPSLLFVIGRDYGNGVISNMMVVGNDGLYDKLINAIGCVNAYTGGTAYPTLSGEGVALLDPDIVIEAMYSETGTAMQVDELRKDWSSLSGLRAVGRGSVYFIDSDYVFVPGMRMIKLKRELNAIVSAPERK